MHQADLSKGVFSRHLKQSGRLDFAWRASILIALLALVALIWYTARVLLLGFAGILLAVFLDFLASQVAGRLRIRRGVAFATVAVGISVLLALAAWIAFPRVADQVAQLIHSLPQAFDRLRTYLEAREYGRALLSYAPGLLASANITTKISSLVRSALEGLGGLAIIAVVGLYLGANGSLYERGLLSLFSQQHRGRAREVLNEVGYTMRWWIIGQLIPMGVLGVVSTIGLWLLDISLAFTLGLFTAFMVFIPYIGSLIALAVTLSVAMMQGSMAVLYVTLLFMGIHVVEGYLLTPLVQKRAVYLPPALTIMSQITMGLLLGFLGLALATPLTAVALVLVKMLYLHENPAHH